jgi:general secretion pathway protein D
MKIQLLKIVMILLLLPSISYGTSVIIDNSRENPKNYIDIDFDNAHLKEIVFAVSEYADTAFVFTETVNTPISWTQKNIFKFDLIEIFKKVISSVGYNCTLVKGRNPFYIIKSDSAITDGTLQTSVGVYQLNNIEAETVMDSAEVLYSTRLSIFAFPQNASVVFSGAPGIVTEFITLLGRLDQPLESDLVTIRLKHISVRSGLKALGDLKIFKDENYFPDYWNRSILFRGTPHQLTIAKSALLTIDKPQQGWVDEVAFLDTVVADQAVIVLGELYNDLEIRKITEDRVLISGPSDQVDKAIVTIGKIDGTGLQVKVEAIIAYLTDREFKELGLRLQYTNRGYSAALNKNLTNTLLVANTGLLTEYFNDLLGIDFTLAAKDGIAHGEILSSPVLTVLNGHEGKIHVGQNVPYLSKANYDQNDGRDVGTSIKRRDIGLTFTVVPRIEPDGDFIHLSVYQEVSHVTDDSELSQEAVDIIIDKKEISTDVLVANGDTIFLGGLRSEESGNAKDMIPLLGDLPFVGRLFHYDVSKKETRHLVVSLRVNVIGKDS